MTTLKPYPAYRDSGVEWFGAVPEHWESHRLKTVAMILPGATPKSDNPDFWNGDILWATPEDVSKSARLTSTRRTITQDGLDSCAAIESPPGSVIVTCRAPIGNVSIAVQPMATNQGCKTAVPNAACITTEFLFRSLCCVKAELQSLGTGSTFAEISATKFSAVGIPLPPFSEQRAIASFLGAMDARITRFIAARKKMIRLLEEKKQAVINQAVTKGLDPTVPMKDSGVDWLGEIPAHWDYAAVGRYWKVADCKHVTVPFVSPDTDTVPLASVVQAQSFDLDLAGARHTTKEWYRFLIEGGRKPQNGDLIFCRNVSVGSTAYVGANVQFAMGQDVCLLSSSSRDSRFLNYCLAGGPLRRSIDMLLVGSTFHRINVAEIRTLKLPLPPDRREQRSITAFLDREVSRFDSITERSRREIELMQEYRTRLISDVVTGKLDVRGVNLGGLPDFDKIPEPDDADDRAADNDGVLIGDIGEHT